MRVIIDAMGGDNAPEESVKGAVRVVSLQKAYRISKWLTPVR